jgi:hypothetical protein
MTPYSLVDDYHYLFMGRGEVPTPFSDQTTSHNLTSEKLYPDIYLIRSKSFLWNEFKYSGYTAKYNDKCVLGAV